MAMTPEDALERLRRVGALIDDTHVVLASGRHSDSYVNKDALFPYTEWASDFAAEIARCFLGNRVNTVIGPAVGAIGMAMWTAHHLTEMAGHQVHAVYSEAGEIRRGFDRHISDKNVLVVEDILTTGASARATIQAVQSCQGAVVGLGALCNRGGVTLDELGVARLFSVVSLSLESWDEENCPLCFKGILINTQVGHGREFVARLRRPA